MVSFSYGTTAAEICDDFLNNNLDKIIETCNPIITIVECIANKDI